LTRVLSNLLCKYLIHLNSSYLKSQKFKLYYCLILLLLGATTVVIAKVETLEIEFYGQQINLSYEDALAEVSGVKFSEPEL